jgi:hypothetical protein
MSWTVTIESKHMRPNQNWYSKFNITALMKDPSIKSNRVFSRN